MLNMPQMINLVVQYGEGKKATIDTVHQKMVENAKKAHNERGYILPTWALVMGDGIAVFNTVWNSDDSKYEAAARVANIIQRMGIRIYSFAVEAWVAQYPAGVDAGKMPPPRDMDNRVDVIYVQTAERNAKTIESEISITTNKWAVKLGEPKTRISDTNNMEGMMANLFKAAVEG